MAKADAIARHVTQAATHIKTALELSHEPGGDVGGCVDAAARYLNAAFLEALGGAAVAGEAAGPWVVRVTVRGSTRWHSRTGPAESFLNDASTYDARAEADAAAAEWGTDYAATVLPLAEAERMEAAATLGGLPAHTRKVLAELADEEPSAEVLAADDSPDEPVDPCARCGQERAHLLHAPISPGALCHGVGPLRDVYAHPFVAAAPTPSPPKPAGWVVRWGIPGSYLFSQGIGVELGVSDPTDAHVYTSKADAEADARTVKHEVCVLPFAAAGSVIEDIGATLRREECERKAARQSGVAWEAARAGEEAERLRGELAAVKAERDAARADRDAALTEREDLRGARRALRYALRRVAEAVGGMVSSEASTEMHCAVPDEVRLAVEKLKHEEALSREGERIARAERDAFKARAETLECERDSLREHLAATRTELAAVKAERDEVRAERDKWAANAGTLNASLRQVHTECDQLRAELDATLAERDALAAEVQRAREQKPWRWIVFGANGRYLGTTSTPTLNHEDEAKDWRLAPLYLAPVVHDHSGVIAQCEEALRAWDCGISEVIHARGVAAALRAALAALRGAS